MGFTTALLILLCGLALFTSLAYLSTCCVILRRQVPIRFDEEPRSWLGGLPHMPDHVDWPEGPDGHALDFMAQIDCSALPFWLWSFQGPRRGWLLVFFDALSDDDDYRADQLRILHIKELGPERAPPETLRARRHALNESLEGDAAMSPEVAPKHFRRWPVDIVVMNNFRPILRGWFERFGWVEEGEPEEDKALGERIYGAPVDSVWLSNLTRARERPLTLRGALYFVEALRGALSPSVFERSFRLHGVSGRPGTLQSFHGPPEETGWLEREREAIRKNKDEYQAQKAKHEADLDLELAKPEGERLSQRESDHLRYLVTLRNEYIGKEDQRLAVLAPFEGPDGEVRAEAEFARLAELHFKWGDRQRAKIEDWRGRLMAQDLDAPLSDTLWQELMDMLKAEPSEYWERSVSFGIVSVTLEKYSRTARDLCKQEELLDLYTDSAARRALIPPDLLAELEPKMRQIDETPHQMGGMRSVVQGDDDSVVSFGSHLLLQLGSDQGMSWMWGDLGALYVRAPSNNLWRRRFNGIQGWIDCH